MNPHVALCVLSAALLLAPTAYGQTGLTAASVLELGGAANSGGVELGLPRAVALDGPRIWIADEYQFRVIVYDSSSKRAHAVGRRGAGPSEFLNLAAMTLLEPGRVAVLDRMNMRVSEIQLGEHGLSVTRTISIDVASPEHMCSTGDTFLLLGTLGDASLHEVDQAGNRIRSFGSAFMENEPRLRDGISLGKRGFVACLEAADPSSPAAAIGSREFGIIHMYRQDGSLVWRLALPDFRPIDISRDSRGGIVYRVPPEGSYHIVVSVLPLASAGTLLVQVGEVSSGTWDEVVHVVSHELSITDGRLKSTRRDLPRMDAVGPGVAAGIDNSLYPMVRLFRIARES
jgi:hypothetical protein